MVTWRKIFLNSQTCKDSANQAKISAPKKKNSAPRPKNSRFGLLTVVVQLWEGRPWLHSHGANKHQERQVRPASGGRPEEQTGGRAGGRPFRLGRHQHPPGQGPRPSGIIDMGCLRESTCHFFPGLKTGWKGIVKFSFNLFF